MHLLGCVLQIVLEVASGPEPVRMGLPVEVAALRHGLATDGGSPLHWRRLPLGERGGLCWIELGWVGAGGTVRVRAANGTHGAPAALDRQDVVVDGVTTTTWRWADGTIDERRRTLFLQPTVVDGEAFDGGEACTDETPGLAGRCRAAARLPRQVWERAGLLPRDLGLGTAVRRQLQQVAHALVELPGRRGSGDYGRSGGVVTNLEFDTTLALLRLALALRDEPLLLRARRSAWHLLDRDLDPASGLPFGHGPDHRRSRPEPGHAWLQGLLWVAAITADETLLAGARQLAQALALAPPPGEGESERARDLAWPLLELEGCLRWLDDPALAVAADRLAWRLHLHFDEATRTFRFGEGEVGDGIYFERAWLTGGVVLPALAAHLRRRPDAELQRRVDLATAMLTEQVEHGPPGLPTHWRVRGREVFAVHRGQQDPKTFLLLEGLPLLDLKRLLRRDGTQRALSQTPALDDPDLATSFTMIARCDWVYR